MRCMIPVLAVALALPLPAGAAGLCTAQVRGTLSCQAGRICECAWHGGTTWRGPEGFAWDCEPTHGTCLSAAPGWAGASPPGSPWRPLSGPDVVVIQERLNAAGYHLGRPDGIVGPRTRRAIRAFQADHALRPDGTPSAALLNLLP
jgi:hypothetical protein